jgi:hypothetical protein
MELFKLYNTKDHGTNIEDLESGRIKTSIIAKDGIYEKMHSWLGYSVRKAIEYTFAGYDDITEKLKIINRDNLSKVPADALLTVIKWYKNIQDKNGQEAQVNFYNTRGKDTLKVDGEYVQLEDIEGIHFWSNDVFTYCPKQKNSGANTSVDKSDKYYDKLNEQIGIFVETHSHNNMGAFASGEDLLNSKNDSIQLVFGKLDTNNPEMHSWVTVRDLTKENISIEDLSLFIELPESITEKDGKFIFDIELINQYENETLFEIWDNQVIKPVYTWPFYGNRNRKHTKPTTNYTYPYYNYPYYQDYQSLYQQGYQNYNNYYNKLENNNIIELNIEEQDISTEDKIVNILLNQFTNIDEKAIRKFVSILLQDFEKLNEDLSFF